MPWPGWGTCIPAAQLVRAMIIDPALLRVLNLALAFYNVGTIWAHEIDIFRSWRLVNVESFRAVQAAHWRKLGYWISSPSVSRSLAAFSSSGTTLRGRRRGQSMGR